MTLALTRKRSSFLLIIAALIILGLLAIPFGFSKASASTTSFNANGNILITDQFNNRVIEVNASKKIVWSFGSNNPGLCNPGPTSVIAPNDAERLANGLTLIAGTGTSICADNRVMIVNRTGQIVWQYGQAGVSGTGPNQLNTPVFAVQLPSYNVLIVDQANARVIEVNSAKKIVWQYGPTSGPGMLNNPNSAELLNNGHILIADENNNRALEINRAGQIVWQYTTGLQTVAFLSRLPNDHTLITDSGNNRIVELSGDALNETSKIVWSYSTNTGPGSNANPNPTSALRLSNGNTVIADQFNNRVIIVNHTGQVVWQYGVTNVVGNGVNQLNAPYSAVVIGDYTGVVTPPGLYY